MYFNIFRALNHGLDILKTYEHLEICITSKNKFRHTIRYVYGEYVIYCNGSSLDKNRQETIKFLLKLDILIIQIYGSIGINYVDKIGFHHKFISANKIRNAWIKYRTRTARIRNDLVIHGLAEYFYHPSKVSF